MRAVNKIFFLIFWQTSPKQVRSTLTSRQLLIWFQNHNKKCQTSLNQLKNISDICTYWSIWEEEAFINVEAYFSINLKKQKNNQVKISYSWRLCYMFGIISNKCFISAYWFLLLVSSENTMLQSFCLWNFFV